MTTFPDTDTLIGIFHNITSTMLDMNSSAAPSIATLEQQKELLYCTGVLPMPGPVPITVAVSSDLQGCTMLSASLFAVEPTNVEADMISDTIAELSNMLAGQLKGFLNLNQNLGLPKVFTKGEFTDSLSLTSWKHIAVVSGNAKMLISFSDDPAIVGLYLT